MSNSNILAAFADSKPRTVALARAGNPTAIALLAAAYDRRINSAIVWCVGGVSR